MKLSEAKKLCSKDEFQWVEKAYTGAMEEMNLRELREGVKRVRNLRNKYRDLEKNQRHRAKRAPKSSDPRDFFGDPPSARTTQKFELFAEVLGQFENQLAAVEGTSSPEVPASSVQGLARGPRRVITTVKKKDSTTNRYQPG